jgi:hypothetical protein
MTRNRDLIGHWPPFGDVLTRYIVPFRAGTRLIVQSHRMARADYPRGGPAPLRSCGAPYPHPQHRPSRCASSSLRQVTDATASKWQRCDVVDGHIVVHEDLAAYHLALLVRFLHIIVGLLALEINVLFASSGL